MEKTTYICDRCESPKIIAGHRNYGTWELILDIDKAFIYDKHVCSIQCACLLANPPLENIVREVLTPVSPFATTPEPTQKEINAALSDAANHDDDVPF